MMCASNEIPHPPVFAGPAPPPLPPPRPARKTLPTFRSGTSRHARNLPQQTRRRAHLRAARRRSSSASPASASAPAAASPARTSPASASNPVTADDYVRAMQQELRALQQQTGRSLTMAEARQYGVDGMVLARLVNDAALDGEAARLGLSTGDEAVRAQVTATPAFQGTDGSFDRETYAAALERASLRPADFEELLRRESTRDLLAGGVQSAATLPDSEALTVLGFLGERRSFDWLRLDAALLPAPIPEPDRGRSRRRARRARRRPLHPPRDAADRLRQRHPRDARRRDRDPRGRAPRRLRRRDRPLPDPGDAARSTASASAPTRRPPRPRRRSTPARPTSTRSPPRAA